MITGFFMAWGMFCAIPCPHRVWDEDKRRWMLIMYPFLGLMMGALWFALYGVLLALEVPVVLTAAAMTVYPFLVSGCIHLDGFMDVSDAVLSRRDLAARQRILKDSHVGSFAVIRTVMLFLFFFAAMLVIAGRNCLLDGAFLGALMAASRGAAAFDTIRKKPLATSQYAGMREADGATKAADESVKTADGAGKTGAPAGPAGLIVVWEILALTLAIVLQVLRASHGAPLTYPFLLAGPLLAHPAAMAAGAYARGQLGGMSGDIAGYQVVTGELTGVLAIALAGYYWPL